MIYSLSELSFSADRACTSIVCRTTVTAPITDLFYTMFSAGNIELEWEHEKDHSGLLSLKWLREHCYSQSAREAQRVQRLPITYTEVWNLKGSLGSQGLSYCFEMTTEAIKLLFVKFDIVFQRALKKLAPDVDTAIFWFVLRGRREIDLVPLYVYWTFNKGQLSPPTTPSLMSTIVFVV